MPRLITEDDWIKPLVVLRDIAEAGGVTLTHEEEQEICREAIEAIVLALVDEVQSRV
jgi:hypothetical protein